MLRAYFVHDKDEAEGQAVIAETAREAKNIVYYSKNFISSEFTDLRVRWLRGVNITGLEKGMVTDDIDALKRGMYSEVEGVCEACKANELLQEINGRAVCLDCYDKIIFG
ncbi:MAG: hypothetical protein ABFD07_14130 [Methanobacterium sp.]